MRDIECVKWHFPRGGKGVTFRPRRGTAIRECAIELENASRGSAIGKENVSLSRGKRRSFSHWIRIQVLARVESKME